MCTGECVQGTVSPGAWTEREQRDQCATVCRQSIPSVHMEAGPQHTQCPPHNEGAPPQLPAASPFVPLQLSMLCMNLSPSLQ